jgi:hypothetical protein
MQPLHLASAQGQGLELPTTLAVLIGRPMRRQSETWLLLPLLPIFFAGIFPMLLLAFLGFAGLVLLGILLICAGLADGLNANGDFNQEVIAHGFARRTERAVQASNLRSAIRFAAVIDVIGAGFIIAGIFGLFYFES